MAISLTRRVTGKTMSIISSVALLIFLPLLLFAAYQTATIISRAAGKPAKITVDASDVLSEKIDASFIRAFAQGGEESGDWLSPVKQEVADLHPRWIRIDHVFDYYDIVKNEGGTLSFDFSRFDALLDSIRATGATPVIALSYMPATISRDGSVISPPKDWNDWALVVQKTIEHVSGQAGKNIPDVYYEVWNEPDHEQFGGWKLSGEKNYLTLYAYAARGASQASQTQRFFLGGPATTGLYKEWITKLIQSAPRLDFLSWHTYLVDPRRFSQDQKNIISWLLTNPEAVLLPKMITEFGFTGAKDSRYGTAWASAHAAAVFRELAIARPQGLFTFQLKDGPNQEKGDGWGIIGHQSQGKQLKPRYHVYALLDRIKGNRLTLTGEGTWVKALATLEKNTVAVLLVNFDANGTHAETVPVTIANLQNGTYSYRLTRLTGNSLNETQPIQEAVTKGFFTQQVLMSAQSVVVLELTKLP